MRWDKTSGHWFAVNQARLKMGFLVCNLLHLIQRLNLRCEKKRRSVEWMIMRLVKVGARIIYHPRYWHVHIASACALRHHYRVVFGWKY